MRIRFQFSVNFTSSCAVFFLSLLSVTYTNTYTHIIQTAFGHCDINAPLLHFNVSENVHETKAETRKK